MRTVFLILIIGVLALIAAIATGFLDISQTRPAQVPQISTNGTGVTASGGQAPAFDVQTGSVKVGTTQTTVKVPAIEVQKPAENEAQENAVNAM